MIKNEPFEIMNIRTGQVAVVENEGINGNWYIQGFLDINFTDVIEWDRQAEWQKI